MIECICQKTKILQNKILTTDSNVLSKIFHVRHKSIIKQVDYLNIIHYFVELLYVYYKIGQNKNSYWLKKEFLRYD